MILSLFKRKPADDHALTLCNRVIEASRQPALYQSGQVPDTFEGRFESLALHTFLLMRRLRALPAPAGDVAQELVDHVFSHLRQAGIGDVSVPKRMKKLAQGFYGRVEAYEAALEAQDRTALIAALTRNVASGQDQAPLADYVNASVAALASFDLDRLLTSGPKFPALNG
jgi:cytochrome b pre-mRNA-processing protein 3